MASWKGFVLLLTVFASSLNCHVTKAQPASSEVHFVHTYSENYYQFKDVGLFLEDQTSLLFEVQTCNDAHIALSTNWVQWDYLTYEIVIGGWINTKSVIRRCTECRNVAEAATLLIVDCHAPKKFWVSWEHGTLRVGKDWQVGENEVLQYIDNTPYTVRFVAISTGWGATGDWRFVGERHPWHNLTSTPNRNTHFRKDGWMYFTTPDLDNYIDIGYYIVNVTAITFEVHACNDAHIALAQNFGNFELNTYEIVFGGWTNTQSAIRKCQKCDNLIKVHTAFVISCDELRPFWISWDNSRIQVGKGHIVHRDGFMSYDDPNPFDVKYVGISTGFGSHGDWIFPMPDNLTILATEDIVVDNDCDQDDGCPNQGQGQGPSQGQGKIRIPGVVEELGRAGKDLANSTDTNDAALFQANGYTQLLMLAMSAIIMLYQRQTLSVLMAIGVSDDL